MIWTHQGISNTLLHNDCDPYSEDFRGITEVFSLPRVLFFIEGVGDRQVQKEYRYFDALSKFSTRNARVNAKTNHGAEYFDCDGWKGRVDQ